MTAAMRDGLGGDNPLAEAAARRRRRFPSARAAFENFASKPPLDVMTRESLEAYVEGGFETLAQLTRVRLNRLG